MELNAENNLDYAQKCFISHFKKQKDRKSYIKKHLIYKKLFQKSLRIESIYTESEKKNPSSNEISISIGNHINLKDNLQVYVYSH